MASTKVPLKTLLSASPVDRVVKSRSLTPPKPSSSTRGAERPKAAANQKKPSASELATFLASHATNGEAWFELGMMGGGAVRGVLLSERDCYERAVTNSVGVTQPWAAKAWAALAGCLMDNDKAKVLEFEVTRDQAFFVAHKLAKAIEGNDVVTATSSSPPQRKLIGQEEQKKLAREAARRVRKSVNGTTQRRSRSAGPVQKGEVVESTTSLDYSLAVAKANARTQPAAQNQRHKESVLNMVVSEMTSVPRKDLNGGRRVMTKKPLASGQSEATVVSVVPLLSELDSQYGQEFAQFQQQLKSGLESGNAVDLKSMTSLNTGSTLLSDEPVPARGRTGTLAQIDPISSGAPASSKLEFRPKARTETPGSQIEIITPPSSNLSVASSKMQDVPSSYTSSIRSQRETQQQRETQPHRKDSPRRLLAMKLAQVREEDEFQSR